MTNAEKYWAENRTFLESMSLGLAVETAYTMGKCDGNIEQIKKQLEKVEKKMDIREKV